MFGNLAEEIAAKLAQFLFTHAAVAGEFRITLRIESRHLAQRHVRENDIRWYPAFISEFLPERAQLFEQCFVARDFTDALLQLCPLGPGDRPRQLDLTT